jgi:hypothetical protein
MEGKTTPKNDKDVDPLGLREDAWVRAMQCVKEYESMGR